MTSVLKPRSYGLSLSPLTNRWIRRFEPLSLNARYSPAHVRAKVVAQQQQQQQQQRKNENGFRKSFLGVEIPEKPTPPGEEDCCQSGCAICVYDLYLEDLKSYQSKLEIRFQEIESKIVAKDKDHLQVDELDWPDELKSFLTKTNRGEKVEAEVEMEMNKVKHELDPTLRAFLEMEAKIKAKQK